MLILFYTALAMLVFSLSLYVLQKLITYSDNNGVLIPANDTTCLEDDNSYDDFICMMLSDGTTIFGLLGQTVSRQYKSEQTTFTNN